MAYIVLTQFVWSTELFYGGPG